MEIPTNPSLEQLKLILWIAGAAMLIMLGIIGFFIGAQFKALTALTGAVNTIEKSVTSLKTQLEIQAPVTERRLNGHAEEIKEIDKRLIGIERDHHIYHKAKTPRHEKDA